MADKALLALDWQGIHDKAADMGVSVGQIMWELLQQTADHGAPGPDMPAIEARVHELIEAARPPTAAPKHATHPRAHPEDKA